MQIHVSRLLILYIKAIAKLAPCIKHNTVNINCELDIMPFSIFISKKIGGYGLIRIGLFILPVRFRFDCTFTSTSKSGKSSSHLLSMFFHWLGYFW